jgi:hypothetical protein
MDDRTHDLPVLSRHAGMDDLGVVNHPIGTIIRKRAIGDPSPDRDRCSLTDCDQRWSTEHDQ